MEKPIEIVIREFGKAGTSDIRQAHFCFTRSVMPRGAFGDVSYSGSSCLGHLVKLAAAGIVSEVKKGLAEVLRGELDDVGKDPGIEPKIGGAAEFHKRQLFLEISIVVYSILLPKASNRPSGVRM